jgi:hypothetical protein
MGFRVGAATCIGIAAIGMLVMLAGAARAEPIDDRTRAAARELAESGLALYEKGDFSGALERFQKAEKLVAVPTIAVQVARCLAALGRNVEASEKYLAIGAMPIDAAAPAAYQAMQQNAKAEAKTELEALRPKIARIEIVVEGGTAESVTLDGEQLPLAMVGTAVPVDAGEHRVGARRGSTTRTDTVSVAEGETGRVVVQLPAGDPVVPDAGPTPVPEVAPVSNTPPDSSAATMTTLGWVGIGVGGASLLAGVVTGGLALDLQGDLRDRCPDEVCLESQAGPDAEDDIARYGALRSASIATLVCGGVLATAGVVLLMTAPSEEAAAVRVEVVPVAAGGGVRGRF